MREKRRVRCPECGRPTAEVVVCTDGSRFYVHSKKPIGSRPFPLWELTDSCFVPAARKEAIR